MKKKPEKKTKRYGLVILFTQHIIILNFLYVAGGILKTEVSL